jgi:hypothetical protein
MMVPQNVGGSDAVDDLGPALAGHVGGDPAAAELELMVSPDLRDARSFRVLYGAIVGQRG